MRRISHARGTLDFLRAKWFFDFAVFQLFVLIFVSSVVGQNQPLPGARSETEGTVQHLHRLADRMESRMQDSIESAEQDGIECLRILADHPNEKLETKIRILLSNCATQKGEPESSLSHARRALEIAKRINDQQAVSQAEYHVALALWYSGDVSGAIESADRAYSHQLAIDDDPGMAKSLTLLGAINRSRSDYHESLLCHKRALEISTRNSDQSGIARSQNNIGLVYWRLEQHERALQFLKQALGYYKRIGKKGPLTTALSNVGLIYVELEKPDLALKYLQECLELMGATSSRSKARLLSNLGFAYEAKHDLGTAMEYYRQALDIREGLKDYWGSSRTLGSIGNIQAKRGLHEDAIKNFRSALTYAEQSDAREEQAKLCENLAASYEALGDHEAALISFRKSVEIDNELNRSETARKISELEAAAKIEEQQNKLNLSERTRIEQSLDLSRQRAMKWLYVSVFSMVLLGVGIVFLISQARAMRLERRICRQLQAALSKARESEDRYRCVFENSEVPKFIFSAAGKMLDMNTAASNHCQVSIARSNSVELEKLPAHWEGALRRCLRGNESSHVQVIRDQQNEPKAWEFRTAQVMIDERACTFVVALDITEQQRIKGEQIRLEKMESLGLMAGGIAHDFRNSLTAILGFVEIARVKSGHGSEVDHYLERAELAGDQAEWLTSQLISFSKGGSPDHKAHNLQELLVEAVDLGSSGAMMEIVYAIDPALPEIVVDEGQFKQVISNLVINAHQAMECSGKLVVSGKRVDSNSKVGLCGAGEYVRIQLQDSGPGIPDDICDKVFDPYYTTKEFGSGLGLSTAYSIVQQYGGHMDFQSVEGEGTTFSIYLPVDEEQRHSSKQINETT